MQGERLHRHSNKYWIILQGSPVHQIYGNHSLSPALIIEAHTEKRLPDKVFTHKALLGILVCQLSACEPNSLPPLPSPVNYSRTVLMPANLSCHPHAIVIHVFIHLCSEKDEKAGRWVSRELGGRGMRGNGRTWKRRPNLKVIANDSTKLARHTLCRSCHLCAGKMMKCVFYIFMRC